MYHMDTGCEVIMERASEVFYYKMLHRYIVAASLKGMC